MSLSVVIACVAFTLVFLGVCRPPIGHFWRESLSLVSWCLSYFALHFVFIACVAYKFVFSWRVSSSGCFHPCVAFQLAISACVAYKLFSWRVTPSGCFHACVAFQLAISACVAYKLFSWRVTPSGCFYGVCRL